MQRVLDRRRVIVQAAQSRRYSKVAVAARSDDADATDIHVLGPRLQSWHEDRWATDVSSRPPARQREPATEPQGSKVAQDSGAAEYRDDQSTPGDRDQDHRLSFLRKTKSPPIFFPNPSKGYGNDPRVLYDRQFGTQNKGQENDFQGSDDYNDLIRVRKAASLARARQSSRAANFVRFHELNYSFKKDYVQERDANEPEMEAEQQIISFNRYHKAFGGLKRQTENVARFSEASDGLEPIPNEQLETSAIQGTSKDSAWTYTPLSGVGDLSNDDLLSQAKTPYTSPGSDRVDQAKKTSVLSPDEQPASEAVHLESREIVTPFAPFGLAVTSENDNLPRQPDSCFTMPESHTPEDSLATGVNNQNQALVSLQIERAEPAAEYSRATIGPRTHAPFGLPTKSENRSLSSQVGTPPKVSKPAEDPELSKSMRTNTSFGLAAESSNDDVVSPTDTHSTIPELDAASTDPPSAQTNRSVDDSIRLAMDGLDEEFTRSLAELLEGFETFDTPAPEPSVKRRKVTSSQATGEGQRVGQLAETQGSRREPNEFDTIDGPYAMRNRWLKGRIGRLVYASMAHHQHVSVQETEALWPHAICDGSSGDIRRLYHWMIDNGSFTTAHGRSMVEASSRLNETSGGAIDVTLFAEVLNAEDYGKSEPEEVFKQKMRLLSHAVTWNVPSAAQMLGSLLLKRKTRRALEEPVIVRAFESECRHLLSTAGASFATQLLTIANNWLKLKHGPSIFKLLLPLTTEILKTAIEEGDSRSCIRILRRNQKMLPIEDFREQFNQFLETCGKQRSYSTVAKVIADGPDELSPQLLFEIANESNKAILAVAFCSSIQLKSAFEGVYRQVPSEFRDFVNEHAATEAIRATWTSTRNIDKVETEAQQLSTRLQDRGDEMALSKLDDVLLEVYLKSGKHNEALECLTRIHKKRYGDVQFVALAALYFAKRWDWDGLAYLLDTSRAHAPFEFDENSTRLLNEVIRFYSQTHSPLETWLFITSAIDELGFSPNFATAQLMLYKMIRSKSIDLIPRWLRFLSAIGADFGLTGPRAGELIRQYYLWNRQPSELLFRLSHKLTTSVPYFNVDHFMPVLKMAIAHDLQFGSGGGDASSVQQQSLARLQQLRTAIGTVPESVAVNQHSDDVRGSGFVEYDMASDSESRTQDSEEQYHRTISLFNEQLEPAEASDEGFVVFRSEEVFKPSKDEDEAYVTDEGIDAPDEEEGSQNIGDHTLRRARATRGQQERNTETKSKREVEEDMALNFSMHKHQETLNQYHSSCDSTGLPLSVRALKHATGASIRLHKGDTTRAEKLIADAKASGMDVSRAMDPLLIHRSSVLTIHDAREARRVCDATIEYYGQHFKDGHHLRYALAHTVADVLVSKGHAEQALRLLSTIFQSDYIARKIPSIKTMSVWMKAYAKLLSMDGVRWVVRRVLLEDFLIDRIFLGDLEKVSTFPFSHAEQKRLRGWLKLCQDKRIEQDLEAKMFGNQLVDCLIEYSHRYPPQARPRKSKRQRAMTLHARSQRRGSTDENVTYLEKFDVVDRADAGTQSHEAFATYQPYAADSIGPPVVGTIDERTC